MVQLLLKTFWTDMFGVDAGLHADLGSLVLVYRITVRQLDS